MGNACCIMRPVNCEYNISNDDNLFNKSKNVFNSKTSNSMNNVKDEEKCSILINSFCKETNYIVSYKESQERKIIESKLKENLNNNINAKLI